MSLVAYDSSDDSEDEKSSIPKSLADPSVKKRRECVKITIPSLREFEDEESPAPIKKQKLQSGSNLFNLLPPPKNAPTLSKPGFVPYVLSSKKEVSSLTPKTKEIELSKTEATPISLFSKEQDSDDKISCISEKFEENANVSKNNDFFSLGEFCSKDKITEKVYLSSGYLTIDSSLTPVESSNIQSTSSAIPSTSSSDIQQSFLNELTGNSYFEHHHQLLQTDNADYKQEPPLDHQSHSHTNYSAASVFEHDSKESYLKDKEFLKLHGRHREFEAIDIIDVNVEDQLTDRNEWLMKSLTEESTHRPTKKKHNMPTQQQKRKHQITYLAFQAKEREMDLKNQWSLNSRTRRETQAKYGF